MKGKKAAVLFSGGKDSSLALHKAVRAGYEVVVLLAMLPETMDSMMFHTPNEMLLKKQAEMLNLPLMIEKTKAREEREELSDLKELIAAGKEKYKFDTIVVGGISSSYQGKRIKKIADDTGLEIYVPLWDYTSDKLWNELLSEGFKIILTKISCDGISKEFLGEIIQENELVKLRNLAKKYKFKLNFEGGEAETSVLWMPEFSKEIKIEFEIYSEGEYRHFLKVKEAK